MRWTMTEKAYNSMKLGGACSLVLGILILCMGVTCGVLSILNGAQLLKGKSGLTF